ncbi:potassium channel-like protein [Lineolata rhizophorae]|uniref:Potassium channel-like protein n=1 Tax=Lineolata rhizophorae TaxID=578093 RepID=A0A6A6NM64_9PEZI|nr:potassium channel-like protein [Lineolata rhizophorae]
MNDPHLDEPVSNAVDDIEGNVYEKPWKKDEKEEQAYFDPSSICCFSFRRLLFLCCSRWWFASTACPLIAGTFGPMANAFSICALVQNWRVHIPPGRDEHNGINVKDPSWVIAINAVQLVCSLVANIALLLNMARRVSFAVAQPITVIGWYISAILLIALVSVASTPIFRLDPRSEHALTQAYYYGIIAAGLYFIIASLMMVTIVGAMRGHYQKGFRLTNAQRTLMLQTISFMAYLLLGALVFSVVEGWQYLDAVYWADFTLLTVGIGDFAPMTHTGRSLLFPYAIGGIVMVGLVIGSIRSLILERGKFKMEARMTEQTREAVLANINANRQKIRVGLFRRLEYERNGLTERQKREQEFKVMRVILAEASSRRRWTALAMSTMAAFALWFLGALVFMYSEHRQGWSYFVALYYAYVSLLTIGYGELTLISNAGKPAFVFWTMLAVPTLTILISNMGDTVVKAFSDFTIWLGSLTLLPEEGGFRATLAHTAVRVGRSFSPFLRTQHDKSPPADDDPTMDRLAAALDDEELRFASFTANNDKGGASSSSGAARPNSGGRGEGDDDELRQDRRFYHYLLAREIRKLLTDKDASPPKEYSYDDWAFYLRLLGQDENDPRYHREPAVRGPRGGPRARPHELGKGDGEVDGRRTRWSWSWLGHRSPLMSRKSEAEWLLDRLSAALEHELKVDRGQVPPERRERPPVCVNEVRRRKAGMVMKKER